LDNRHYVKIDVISCRVDSMSEVRSPPGLFCFFLSDVTLLSLSLRQMLTGLLQILFIHPLNNKISTIGKMWTTGQTSGNATCAGWQPIVWKTTIDNPKPSMMLFRPGESRFERLSTPLFPQVGQAIVSSECADTEFVTVDGNSPCHKSQTTRG
jgi:hypothetical protein